ncbi:MAG: HAMP domain-containing histidine kinase, partial [Pedobacter sp.]
DLSANNLETNFKAIQNAFELSLLQKNRRLNSLYLWGATLFSFMLIIILLLIIRNLDRSKKNIFSLEQLNITIKARNTQLQQTLTELEDSREENMRIMKTVYHDLRGPIGGITMAAELMLDDTHHNTDDVEMLSMIQTSGQDAISLINDMLQVTSVVEINKQPVYLPSLLEFCANIALFKADEKQQEIIVQAEPVLFLVDEEKMRRVIGNLLSNAIKFSAIGGKIILKAYQSVNSLIVTCEDFGVGVPENERELIFDMFTVAKKIGTNGEETFGMGLAICKQIVQAHNGQISCHPKAGYGTVFRIVIKG